MVGAMRSRTDALPRPEAGVRFEMPDTLACSNRTSNLTAVEREPDNEPDRYEPNDLHAHEPSDPAGPCASLAGAIVEGPSENIRHGPGTGVCSVGAQQSDAPRNTEAAALPLLRVLARVALAVAEREAKMEKLAS